MLYILLIVIIVLLGIIAYSIIPHKSPFNKPLNLTDEQKQKAMTEAGFNPDYLPKEDKEKTKSD